MLPSHYARFTRRSWTGKISFSGSPRAPNNPIGLKIPLERERKKGEENNDAWSAAFSRRHSFAQRNKRMEQKKNDTRLPFFPTLSPKFKPGFASSVSVMGCGSGDLVRRLRCVAEWEPSDQVQVLGERSAPLSSPFCSAPTQPSLSCWPTAALGQTSWYTIWVWLTPSVPAIFKSITPNWSIFLSLSSISWVWMRALL